MVEFREPMVDSWYYTESKKSSREEGEVGTLHWDSWVLNGIEQKMGRSKWKDPMNGNKSREENTWSLGEELDDAEGRVE